MPFKYLVIAVVLADIIILFISTELRSRRERLSAGAWGANAETFSGASLLQKDFPRSLKKQL